MAVLKNIRHFNTVEKAKAKKQLIDWMSSQFDLPEGETYEAIAKDAIQEASKDKVIDLFNEKGMVESLVFKSRQIIGDWM